MPEDARPIILIVCNEPERLQPLRQAMRSEGVLTAPARSLDAALGLLTQVGVDGCVLAMNISGAAAVELDAALSRCRANGFRICLQCYHGAHLSGWDTVDEDALIPEVWRQFRLLPPPWRPSKSSTQTYTEVTETDTEGEFREGQASITLAVNALG